MEVPDFVQNSLPIDMSPLVEQATTVFVVHGLQLQRLVVNSSLAGIQFDLFTYLCLIPTQWRSMNPPIPASRGWTGF
ncbi:hypothetical protein TNCV_3276261 [Trichonephila clavipes]|nr:hypothetical protein TNCV_3276261 [Trichonephila clavipes]